MPIFSRDNRSSVDINIHITSNFFAVYFVYKLLQRAKPFHRGFYCDDDTLKYPFKSSTITDNQVICAGFSIPIVLIIITECWRWKLGIDRACDIRLFSWIIPKLVVNIYKHVGVFLFATFATVDATDVTKNMIGRLRPHFFDACQPILSDGTNCSNPINWNRYIEDYTCGNTASTHKTLMQLRLSFPSGHASFAVSTALFAVFFLHRRMTWKGSKLLKHFMQFVLIMLAWSTAMSRVSDYKHHCKSFRTFFKEKLNQLNLQFQGLMCLPVWFSEQLFALLSCLAFQTY